MISHYALVELAAAAFNGPWTGTTANGVNYVSSSQGADEIVIALPGTNPDNPKEWLLDFSFWPMNISGIGLIHEGFGAGAQEVWAAIANTLLPDRFVTFTGYSLGGSVASCLGALCAAQRPDLKFRVVTFGAPRVAFLNLLFGSLLSKGVEKTFYARAGDVVPDLPSPFYLHGGAQTDIGVSVGNAIDDHFIEHYALDLKALGV